MQVKIEKYDFFGSGIGYLNDKTVFVRCAIPGEIVEIKVIKEKKNIIFASIELFIKKSPLRKVSLCPYYKECGGCQLLHLDYENTINFKKKKIEELYNKKINIIENINSYNYRNKISLKVKNKKIGYMLPKSNDILEINKCLITSECINEVLEYLNTLNVVNGEIIIRCNYNNELLIIINSEDKISINELINKNYKIVGIVYNDKTIYGENYFIDKINDMFFHVSYNSFFQINPYITSKLFTLINDYINENDIVLDLYSGVGTLSIVESKKAKKVYAIEVVENAVKDSLINNKMNKCNNVFNILGKVEDKINSIEDKINKVVIDPPRSGLDKNSIAVINKINPEMIIYIACDAHTQKRDIMLLNNYEIKDIIVLDMFSFTHHIETICILNRC